MWLNPSNRTRLELGAAAVAGFPKRLADALGRLGSKLTRGASVFVTYIEFPLWLLFLTVAVLPRHAYGRADARGRVYIPASAASSFT